MLYNAFDYGIALVTILYRSSSNFNNQKKEPSMSKNHVTIYRTVIVVLSVILMFTLVQSPRSTKAAPQTAGAQMLGVSVINVNTLFITDVTTTFTKLGDLGIFSVNSADSLLELTFNGRISTGNLLTSTGLIFELRVDDTPSPIGLAQAIVTQDVNTSFGLPAVFTGFFSGLSVGDHTASIWVRTKDQTATNASIDPANIGANVLIVKEHLPFGVAYLPMIAK